MGAISDNSVPTFVTKKRFEGFEGYKVDEEKFFTIYKEGLDAARPD